MQENIVRFCNIEGVDISFTSNSVPAFIIEGMLGEAVTAVFKQVNYFNELYNDANHPKHSEWVLQMKSLSVIAFSEAEQIVYCLKDMKDATLQPKHKAVRKVTKLFLDRLKEREQDISSADENNDQAFTDAMKLILEWLKTTTIILSTYTKNKEVNDHVKEWKNAE